MYMGVAIYYHRTKVQFWPKEMLCSFCRQLLEVSNGYITRVRGTHALSLTPWRSISFLPSMADKLTSAPQRRKDYREEKILGYTPEQVYSVVADVDNYHTFLPWCQESQYLNSSRTIARLAIGFPPLIEVYTATVIAEEPHSLKTLSTDGRLFTKLENSWYFRRGPDLESGPTCLVNFWVKSSLVRFSDATLTVESMLLATLLRVSFEFRTQLYAQLGFLVFDEVARTMAKTFEGRCGQLYGADHLKVRGVRSIAGIRRLLDKSKSKQLRKHGKFMESE